MMIGVIVVLVAAFLWAIGNHIDKYMLCKMGEYDTSLKTLLVFSSFIAGLVLSPI